MKSSSLGLSGVLNFHAGTEARINFNKGTINSPATARDWNKNTGAFTQEVGETYVGAPM